MKKIIPFVIVFVAIFGVLYFTKFKKTDIVTPEPVDNVPVVVDDKVVVEKYIRENIKTLAPEQPLLGGTWYVVSVNVNSLNKTGAVIYEDGHIQGTAIFKYSLNAGSVVIENINAISVNDKYIHPIKWPPVVVISNTKFACKTSLVNGYCVTKSAEGAAGSTYTTYTYAKPYGSKTASLSFTIQSTQCLNYDEPQRGECVQKQADYDLLPIVVSLMNSYN
jgi:hypothetical protein